MKVKVYLDGVLQTGVVAFDTRSGTLTRFLEDEQGNRKVDMGTGSMVTEDVQGRVDAAHVPFGPMAG